MRISEIKIERKVELHQTDLGGLMHHHNYFVWMEQAEYELFDLIGEPVVGDLDENLKGSGWPRAEVSMKYLKPLKFRDEVVIHLKITRIRAAALEYAADFIHNGDVVAKGKYKTISCLYDATQREPPQIVPASESFLNKIEVYNEDLPAG